MSAPSVLLVNPPMLLEKPDFGQAGALFTPENLKMAAINPGLLSIATYLDSKGIPVVICDLSIAEDFNILRQIIENFKPDIIGISSMSAFDYIETLNCLKIAAEERPQALRVAGGQHIGMLGVSALIDSPELQVLAKYEGEKVMEDIVLHIQNNQPLSDIAGIVVREGTDIHDSSRISDLVPLDNIPPLKYELYPNFRQFTPFVEESRGCPARCEYCTSARMNRGKIRYKNIEHFEVEINRAIDLWGKDHVFATLAASFGMRSKPTLELAKVFSRVNVKWTTEFRADCNWEAYLDQLYEAGLVVVNVGMESASPEILINMNKTKNPEYYLAKTRQLVKRISQMPKLALRLNVIFYVGETPKTVKETISFLVENAYGIASVLYSPVFITPGSELEKNFQRYEEKYGARLVSSPYWDRRRLKLCQPSKYFSFEESVYTSNALEKVFSTPEGWFASEAYHYRQDQKELKQTLIDGRYSAS